MGRKTEKQRRDTRGQRRDTVIEGAGFFRRRRETKGMARKDEHWRTLQGK